MRTLAEVLNSAREDLKERWDDHRDNFSPNGEDSDVIHEVADANVPIYTSNLMELAACDISLATDTPELGPAFDGSPTPVNIVAANVYEAIIADLYEYLDELRDEEDEEDEEG